MQRAMQAKMLERGHGKKEKRPPVCNHSGPKYWQTNCEFYGANQVETIEVTKTFMNPAEGNIKWSTTIHNPETNNASN